MDHRWKQIEELFHEVAGCATSDREALLSFHCSEDSELRSEVASLAAGLEGADEFLRSRVDGLAAQGTLGASLGNYRLIREIGSGGMGTVYLAVRADGEFRQQVAIKIARSGLGSSHALDLFRRERQVMADLAHPNIARLFDGGATTDGVPYLAMEYIEGEAITSFAINHGLSVKARMKLFLGVCDAVAFAHRNLVVHRDIKPGNILVTADGSPKLLDFGISKLLDPSRGTPGVTTLPLMTPEYASPEQVRGESVTTSTDVYSLGAVLYELLTGQCPHAADSRGPAEIAQAICSVEPAKPSSIAGRTVSPDLDNIVLMALRKEPDRRYLSVEQFSDDIRRYLENRPVHACKDSLRYRAAKFARRHRTGVVAAILLALTLLIGAGCVAWQVHRVAVQVGRAERRFIQFRKLANAFLFDFHSRIQSMTDISEARELVLSTGLEYIDDLAHEAGDDPLFARELARAYEKFGDLQGFRNDAALGRAADALASYRKAIALLERLGQDDADAAILRSRCWCRAGEMIARMTANPQEAKGSYRKCLEAALRAPAKAPRTASTREDLLFTAYSLLGDAELRSGRNGAAREQYFAILRLLERDTHLPAWKKEMRFADTNRRMGLLAAAGGDSSSALRFFRTAAALARQAASRSSDRTAARTLVQVLHDLALHLRRSGSDDDSEAAGLASEAITIAQRLTANNPHHPAIAEELQAALALRSE
jgi:tetratricopeptide (TPR) repeat protein